MLVNCVLFYRQVFQFFRATYISPLLWQATPPPVYLNLEDKEQVELIFVCEVFAEAVFKKRFSKKKSFLKKNVLQIRSKSAGEHPCQSTVHALYAVMRTSIEDFHITSHCFFNI